MEYDQAMDKSENNQTDRPADKDLRARIGIGALMASSPLWVTWVVMEVSPPGDEFVLLEAAWTAIAFAGAVWLTFSIYRRRRHPCGTSLSDPADFRAP
jgi:hypothetical protein